MLVKLYLRITNPNERRYVGTYDVSDELANHGARKRDAVNQHFRELSYDDVAEYAASVCSEISPIYHDYQVEVDP